MSIAKYRTTTAAATATASAITTRTDSIYEEVVLESKHRPGLFTFRDQNCSSFARAYTSTSSASPASRSLSTAYSRMVSCSR